MSDEPIFIQDTRIDGKPILRFNPKLVNKNTPPEEAKQILGMYYDLFRTLNA